VWDEKIWLQELPDLTVRNYRDRWQIANSYIPREWYDIFSKPIAPMVNPIVKQRLCDLEAEGEDEII